MEPRQCLGLKTWPLKTKNTWRICNSSRYSLKHLRVKNLSANLHKSLQFVLNANKIRR